MSNLIYNGTFDIPTITTNSFKFINTDLNTQQKTDLFLGAGPTDVNLYELTTLQNGVSAYNYPSPSLIGFSQFVSIQYTSSISQSFTVTKTGSYNLKFNYTGRSGNDFNYA